MSPRPSGDRVASEVVERRTSEAEARFDRVRAKVGAALAPAVFLGFLLIPLPGVDGSAQRLLAIVVMTAVLWICETIPLAVTALLAPAMAVALGVAPAKQAFAPFAHPLIFLFIGGFMLAESLTAQGFDRRAALWLLARNVVRGSPSRARAMVAATAFGFSMWINNTATAAMMVPIAIGLCASIRELCPDDPELEGRQRRFEEGMLITLAYAASIGGICTPIGTAPNMIAIAELGDHAGVHFDFLRWMSFAVPIAAVTFGAMLLMAERRWPPALDRVAGLTDVVRRELRELGAVSPAERRAVAVFALAIAGWLLPSALRVTLGESAPATAWVRETLPEGVVALMAASLLFVIPAGAAPTRAKVNLTHSSHEQAPHPAIGHRVALMTWGRAAAIDWGTVLLLGGGLALGSLIVDTGLADALGTLMEDRLGRSASQPVLILAAGALVIYTTELVSNTATISMMLPVIMPLAARGDGDPVPVVLTATLAASFAFMLPVSTPPNAIVYGTGLVRMPTMLRFGLRLDLVALLLLVAAGLWFIPLARFW